MKTDWKAWRERARGALPAAGTALWSAALLLLGAVLVAQAGRSGGESAVLSARAAALDREIEGMRRRNQALRDEVKALETDPVYVEALLRRWKRVGEGERRVE
jgi:cell division protein FtsB